MIQSIAMSPFGSANSHIAEPTSGQRASKASTASSPVEPQRAIWQDWADLWNGDYSQGGLISPGFRLHAALMDGSSETAIQDRNSLIQWIKQARSAFQDLRFATQVGPLISGDHIVGRWIASGTYRGGFPGAKAECGTDVSFTGIDILRVHEGMIVEYWTNSDTLSLTSQLKVY